MLPRPKVPERQETDVAAFPGEGTEVVGEAGGRDEKGAGGGRRIEFERRSRTAWTCEM
jgi:hypothetical protein